MQGNHELALKNTQLTVKDGANEELAKRIRATEEIVKQERDAAKLEEQKKITLENRAKYHIAIAALCEKYSGLDRGVVARLSNEDKECLADSIENKVSRRRRRESYLARLHFFVGAGAIGSFSYFVHPAFLFALLVVPVWVPVWDGDQHVYAFLDYRRQTTKEDRISLQDEVKSNGT